MKPLEAERDFWRAQCRDSLYWAFRIAWGYDFNPLGGAGPRKWFRDETHRAACDWLQKHISEWLAWRRAGLNRSKKLAFCVAREFGKSTLATGAVPMWMLLQDPELAITIDSESDEKARMLLGPIAAVLSGSDRYSWFSRLYGSWQGNDPANYPWNKGALVVAPRRNLSRKEPSLGTCSVEKGITMQHPDVFLLDDPISYEKLRAVSNWKDVTNEHVEAMVPVFGEGTLWLWPGTRYGDDDQYGTFLKSEGIATIEGGEMPDLEPREGGEWHVFYLPAIDRAGKLTMPHIWSRKRINNWAKRNPVKCAAQVRLDPFEASINPLTPAQGEACYVSDDDSIPWRLCDYSFHFDLAFKRAERLGKGDCTAFVSWAHERAGSGNIILDGVWGSNAWQAGDLAARVVMEWQRLKKNGCWVKVMTCEREAGGGEGMWENTLRNQFAQFNIPMPRFEYLTRAGKHSDKHERLIGAAAFWRDGRVKIPKDRTEAAELVYQMTHILGSKRKDYADAAADVFNPLVYRAMRAQGDNAPPVPIENFHDELLKGTNMAVTEYHVEQIRQQEAMSEYFDAI